MARSYASGATGISSLLAQLGITDQTGLFLSPEGF